MKQLILFAVVGLFYWPAAYACGDGKDWVKSKNETTAGKSSVKKEKTFSFMRKDKAPAPSTQASQATSR
ncbi:MAG: hypothetical protein QNL04_06890 [SAR324 cluster bacterium]|nr:hypothetical protein [SAR324 cluster bacterium]